MFPSFDKLRHKRLDQVLVGLKFPMNKRLHRKRLVRLMVPNVDRLHQKSLPYMSPIFISDSAGNLQVYWCPWWICLAAWNPDPCCYWWTVAPPGGHWLCTHGCCLNPVTDTGIKDIVPSWTWWCHSGCPRVSPLCHSEVRFITKSASLVERDKGASPN
jgi:hypothetical protein